jgi:glycosyltransferase involved in cell wall biosynthesis
MRIGIFDPYLDDLGGGEKYMITLAQCLSGDNQVTVFWNNPEDLRKVAERFSIDISKIRVKENIFSPSCPFFKRWLESLGYDAIVILSDGSIPFVLSRKLLIHIQQPFPKTKMSLKAILKKMRVNSFFCNSFFTKSFVDKEFGINSQVVYPPVDLGIKGGRKENIILHVGRFRARNVESEDYKKQGLMVQTFKEMVENGLKNWKLILAVGLQDKYRQKFKNLRDKAKGYPIEFLVNLNKDQLSRIYSESKIYWHASGHREDLGRHPEYAEHFGISTVEAMGAGVVPVVINAGGQKEIVENGKNGYLWDSLEEFAKKTISLIENVKLWEEMSMEAIKRSQKFTGDRFCKEIKDIIKE